MKYFELSFEITPNNEAAGDILAALLADAGCETFVPTDEGLTAYIQQALYDKAAIAAAAENLSSLLPDCTTTFTCAEAPDENWNATWEAEHHFQPIDLPDGQQIQIIPRQAFGSGEHATTRMILSLLTTVSIGQPSQRQPLEGLTVIDAGCGTGVLGIAAMKLGAAHIFAYDIDEWSVRNALENFALNNLPASLLPVPAVPIENQAEPVLLAEGDAHILDNAPSAHLLLANINRNILLADLPSFVAHLLPGGRIILSGFLHDDITPLTERALSLGLHQTNMASDGEWRALVFQKGT